LKKPKKLAVGPTRKKEKRKKMKSCVRELSKESKEDVFFFTQG
jgi:hypothetical protein